MASLSGLPDAVQANIVSFLHALHFEADTALALATREVQKQYYDFFANMLLDNEVAGFYEKVRIPMTTCNCQATARICASWVAFSDLAPLDLRMSAAVGKYLAARGLKLADLSASAEPVLLPNLDMVTYHNGWFQGPRSLEETLHRFARWKGFAFTAHQQVALGSLRRAVSAARKRSLFYKPSSSAPARDRARCAADNGIAPTRGS